MTSATSAEPDGGSSSSSDEDNPEVTTFSPFPLTFHSKT